jgi:hypothetical protein
MQLATSCESLPCLQYALSAVLPGYIIMHFDSLFKTAYFYSSNIIDYKNDIHTVFEMVHSKLVIFNL